MTLVYPLGVPSRYPRVATLLFVRFGIDGISEEVQGCGAGCLFIQQEGVGGWGGGCLDA